MNKFAFGSWVESYIGKGTIVSYCSKRGWCVSYPPEHVKIAEEFLPEKSGKNYLMWQREEELTCISL